MSRGGSAVAARSGRPAAPREGAGRGPRQRRPAAAPGPGRLNDEPRRDLRDTFMRSGKEMAAAEPNAGGSAPSRAGGRTPLPPPPRPGGAAAAGAVSPGATRRGREREISAQFPLGNLAVSARLDASLLKGKKTEPAVTSIC